MAVTISGSTGIASVDGSAGSPGSRGTDANSGVFYSADAIKFSTGGTERAVIDNNGLSAAGHVIQYVQATTGNINGRISTNDSSSFVTTGYSVTITPTNASNLIIVGGYVTTYGSAINRGTYLQMHNGNTGSLDANQESGVYFKIEGPWLTLPFKYTCTAGTTSAITFTLYFKKYGGSSSSEYVYLGWSSSPGTTKNWNDMWAMEVAV